ncbi:PA2169 family four-helix-bundle protein [Chitinophaga qingshengii]|uniref:PA2169 family four-helix-bundle protein n=1 Tax=Chitinophaga qingshengii TaxID=1569794 RepID=A0ABR7TYK2_9BACT|nr:PA2169 family four-helix-bundle protein [Chitinophaga qingshengii]MBC9934254.1 PA2169 family four-helix-bundle protein [Chitinophaga qingshengii]
MNTTTATVETLNDLIGINNDRISGYEKALKDNKGHDTDLKALFTHMIDESRTMRNALGKEVQGLGGEMETGTTTGGKLYRAWMELKSVFTGHDRHAILSDCETEEDAAMRAYSQALQEEHLPAYLRELLTAQRSILKTEHDKIKKMRDVQA